VTVVVVKSAMWFQCGHSIFASSQLWMVVQWLGVVRVAVGCG